MNKYDYGNLKSLSSIFMLNQTVVLKNIQIEVRFWNDCLVKKGLFCDDIDLWSCVKMKANGLWTLQEVGLWIVVDP